MDIIDLIAGVSNLIVAAGAAILLIRIGDYFGS